MIQFSLLSGRLSPVYQQAGHDSYVIRDYAPINLRVEVWPRLPFTPKHVEPSFEIRYDGLDPAAPFFEPSLHALAAGQIPERSDDLVEDDVDDTFFLCQLLIREGRIAAIRRHVARHDAVVVLDPFNHATVGLRVPGVAVQNLAVDNQHARTGRQIDLMPERRFAPAFYYDIRMVLEDRKQLVCVRHLLSQNLVTVRHAVYPLRFRQHGLEFTCESQGRIVYVPKRGQRSERGFGLVDAGSKQFQLFSKDFFSFLARLRVVDLGEMLLGLLLVPPRGNHSAGLFSKLYEQAVNGLEAIPHQRIVRRIMDVRLDCRGIGPRLAEIVETLRLSDLVNGDHHLFKRLRFDHRNVFLPDREGNRFSSVKLDEQRADAGIVLGVRQLTIGQRLHLLIQRATKYLFDRGDIFSAETFPRAAFEVFLDQLINLGMQRQNRVDHSEFCVSRPVRILQRERQFVQKLHHFPLADFMRLLYIFPAESAS